jgi:NADH-quinone oxidoreductase subunit N
MMPPFPIPYRDLLPFFILAGGVGAVLLMEVFLPRARAALGWVAGAAIVAAGWAAILLPRLGPDGTRTLASDDPLYLPFALLVLMAGLGTTLLAVPYLKPDGMLRGEFLALILISTIGGLGLAAGRDLLFLFVSLEVLTIPLYILAAYYRDREQGVEAALKYYLFGIVSSAFLLYGIALLYGATGTLDLEEIRLRLAANADLADSLMVRASLGLFIVGIGFKVAAVPFHAWAPDAYHGAPTPVTNFLAVGSKAGGFAFAVRVLATGYAPLGELWMGVVGVLAVASLALGVLLALLQENIKRLLAYSSIAHAGFLLIAVAAQGAGRGGLQALVFYLLAYGLALIGAFAVVGWLEQRYGGPLRIADYAGLGRRHPWMAASLTVCLLSLGGIPPTGGFVAKYLLFQSAVSAGLWWLAILGVLAAVVAIVYYLRVAAAMLVSPEPPEPVEPGRCSVPAAVALIATVAGIFLLGLWPGPLLALLSHVGS